MSKSTPTSAAIPPEKSPALDPNSLTSHALSARTSRLINSEYRRGYMEGQHEAAIALAGLVDAILQKYNHIASVDVVRCEK